MKKFILLLMAIILLKQEINAQQLPDYNLYTKNLFINNPSFAGYLQGANAFLQVRTSFKGIPNSPRIIAFGYHQPIEKYSIGTGAKVTIDQRGIFQTLTADVAAAYKLKIGQNHLISFGMDAGFINRSYNTEGLNENVNLGDPVLKSDYFNKTYFKYSMGISYLSKKIEAGISFPQLVESAQEINPNISVYGAYNFTFADSWLLKPSAYFRTIADGTKQADFNMMLQWNKMIWIQPGYRTNNNLMLSAGFSFLYGGIGYSYNLYSGNYTNLNLNTNEFTLIINLNGTQETLAFLNDRKAGQQRKMRKKHN